MTSSDSSVPNRGAFSALICTHKRGVGLALFPKDEYRFALARAASHLAAAARADQQPIKVESNSTLAFIFENEGYFYATCGGLTAENLSHLYTMLITHAAIDESQVVELSVVVGPGSFTGLRLGCAFANGLSLGRKRALYALDESFDAETFQKLKSPLESLGPNFWGQASTDADDPFATPMSFGDVFIALRSGEFGAERLVDALEPHYGREPTPVLKLREQKERIDS